MPRGVYERRKVERAGTERNKLLFADYQLAIEGGMASSDALKMLGQRYAVSWESAYQIVHARKLAIKREIDALDWPYLQRAADAPSSPAEHPNGQQDGS